MGVHRRWCVMVVTWLAAFILLARHHGGSTGSRTVEFLLSQDAVPSDRLVKGMMGDTWGRLENNRRRKILQLVQNTNTNESRLQGEADLLYANKSDRLALYNVTISRLQERKDRVKRECMRLPINPDHDISTERGPTVHLAHGRLRLCHLEKVGSSSMGALRMEENTLKSDREDATSFVIVRDPYSRLVSGYLDKMFTRSVWWVFGAYIIKHFRVHPSSQAVTCGSDVSFPEFIKYWIHSQETGRNKDGHFRPMHEQCRFCHHDYDFYVHLETLKEDIQYIYTYVNFPLKTSLSNQEATIRDKVTTIVDQRDLGHYTGCETACTMLDRAWWSFQTRGLISSHITNPVKGENCKTTTKEDFTNIAIGALQTAPQGSDKQKQRRELMASLFLTVSLEDRLKVKAFLMKDFKLHGYDPTPHDLFPELFLNNEK